MIGFFMLIGWLVSRRLKSVFTEYSQVALSSGLSGKEVAEKMLRDSNIYDVKVISVEGQLTDHYNPVDKTVNLSHDVYYGRSISAAAVAAHECGHAVQHATAYAWLGLRSALVPAVNFSNRAMNYIFFAMIIFGAVTAMYNQILLIIIILQAAITLFSLVTLPVEIDASQRALVWLNTSRLTKGEEQTQATTALKWAAGTYVVAALASVATLLYFVMQYMGRRD
ncbi:MAG: zinc metallopeptidase [Bacteroidia bacterium]